MSFFHPFPATHWSLVRRAGSSSEEVRAEALGVLLSRYLPALRSYLCAVRHIPVDQAEDLLQAFVADKVLERQLLRHADQTRGRFRSFLLTSLNNFIASVWRGETTQVSLEEAAEMVAPGGFMPEAFLEAEWARALLRQVLQAMKEECVRVGRDDIWVVFEQRIFLPLFEEALPLEYQALADRLQLDSPGQAANLLVTAKRMYDRLLRAAIGEYEPDPGRVEEELADLRRVLSSGKAI